jgi:hypothetical protein
MIGRSVELLALLPAPLAVHRALRAPLQAQIADAAWLHAGLKVRLAERLAAARDWSEDEPFPPLPLLVHDAMGLGGPSREAIPRALREGVPILLTGHLPAGSPGERALGAGQAAWIRLPTHPTWPETLALLDAVRPRLATGHSCPLTVMADLARHRPDVLATVRVGEEIDVAALAAQPAAMAASPSR